MTTTLATAGYGTRIYFLPNGNLDLQKAQILKGQGYVTINLKGAHYRADGNLWQKIFGGTDKVTLSTQVTYTSGANKTSCASIEDVRDISVGKPYYFGSTRFVALKLPTDCDGVELAITMSAIQNDNLSGALNILNSGELQSTLQLAPPAVSEGIAIAGVVKKLLSNTNPQASLQSTYAGRLGTAPASDPLADYRLLQGTIITIYRESDSDTALDNLDVSKLSLDGDGLKYAGNPLQNTYAMFQVSYDELRGADGSAPWYGMFQDAESNLDQLATAANDSEKQKLWAASFASYQQGAKLLEADPTYTRAEAAAIIATHLASLQKKYSGGAVPHASMLMTASFKTTSSTVSGPLNLSDLVSSYDFDKLTEIRNAYYAKLAKANLALPGRTVR